MLLSFGMVPTVFVLLIIRGFFRRNQEQHRKFAAAGTWREAIAWREGLQGFEMIPGLAEALFSVLDGGRGAVADTGHAVGAAFAPDGLASRRVMLLVGQRRTHWPQPVQASETVKALDLTKQA